MSEKKAVMYLRVSTEMQVEGYSLDAQESTIRQYARAYDIDIVRTYKDEGKSGKSIESRIYFQKMLDDIETEEVKVDFVLVYKLSRFGRNAADILTSLQRIQDYGTNLCCIKDNIDSSSDAGKLIIAVLSAVTEIERVNILEQTMAGRQQKAREGKWNGGFSPYGYSLKDGKLHIEETEAETIKIIFDKFINTRLGYNGVAKYLNQQGIFKIPRKNGTLSQWSSKTVREVLDNPVYCGKIAYGRRVTEKVEGTRNDYHQVRKDNYILVEGIHEGIVSAEDWEKAKEKRLFTGIKAPSKIGRDRVHLLAGILKCPECGSPMYTNKHAWTKKDGTYKEVFYYVCSRNRQERGRECSYKASLRKDAIEPDVIEGIKRLVTDKCFAETIRGKIGKEIDTEELDIEIRNYRKSLRQCEKSKESLEMEIDTLPDDEPHRERKVRDKNRRLNAIYDNIVELEEKIDDAERRKKAVKSNALNLEQIYRILLNFDKLFNKMTDREQRDMLSYIVKEIEIYKEPKEKDLSRLKSITFHFPVNYGGETGDKILWDNERHVETVVLLSKGEVDSKKIRLEFSLEDMDMSEFQDGATYPQIKEYVLEHTGLKVSNLYISQIKRKCGLEVGKNYNLPKSEDSRQLQCPPEKEKAIREAFEYFGMI